MPTQNVNLMGFVKPTKQQNTTRSGKAGDKSLVTTDLVKLQSYDDIKELPQKDRVKYLTDFACSCCADLWSLSLNIASGRNTSEYLLRSAATELATRFCRGDGSIKEDYSFQTYLWTCGLCPALSLDLDAVAKDMQSQSPAFVLENVKRSDGQEKHLLKFGQYPKTRVTPEMERRCEEFYNGGNLKYGLRPTGRLYTINGRGAQQGDFLSKQCPEFEFGGQKYIRYVVWDSNFNYFLDESEMAKTVQWFKVEPLSFEILNWQDMPPTINPDGKEEDFAKTIELVSAETVISGIPFYPEIHENCSMWQNSLVRCFLQSGKSEDLDGNQEYSAPLKWDFQKSGFLYQALDMTREKVKSYCVPASETEIRDYAFAGCVGIEKYFVHSGVEKIGSNVFSGIQNAQVYIEVGKNGIVADAAAFNGSAFKFIYISKDGNRIVLSTSAQPELEDCCFKEELQTVVNSENAVAANRAVKFFQNNYRQNYTKTKTWRESGKIKFIPPDYTLHVFPSSELENYFYNNNSKRWGQLVKTLGFDSLSAKEKDNYLVDLMKIYYAIGGFSENQGESEMAYDYIINHVAKSQENAQPIDIASEIHTRFSRLILKGHYNRVFAQFFMKYYRDNPDFMVFQLKTQYGILLESQDYLCAAHNTFESILKSYPNKVVNGNDERALLTPHFVADHSRVMQYDNIDNGNELLAETVGRYGYTQLQFDHIQKVYNKAKKLKDSYVISSDKTNENLPVQFRLLAKDDPLGFVLGDITNCCQVLGGVGESCVDDGYENPNAGFLVFEESLLDEQNCPTGNKRVLGQAYIWYDPNTKTVCYDNIEIPKKVLKELRSGQKHGSALSSNALIDAVERSAESIMEKKKKKGIKVERVTTGEGHNDLIAELSQRFVREQKPAAMHRGYEGYSDATEAQYVIKTYDELTNMYAANILNKDCEISNTIDLLSCQDRSME